MTRRSILGWGALIALAGSAQAQIVTDGSMGEALSLTGPNVRIEQGLGTLRGANLFHSFSDFNVLTGESATFVAGLGIEHIIARVTGGSVSTIDGRLGVDAFAAPGLWLLNPAGVMIGANASLDVPGAFYLSTANSLVLGEQGQLHVDPEELSTLVSAPPTAFGFLEGHDGRITLESARLEMTVGARFSAVAAGVSMSDSVIYAPSGNIDLAAVSGPGQALLMPVGLALSSFDNLGSIEILNPSGETIVNAGRRGGNLDVSGTPGGPAAGSIRIQGGQILVDDASLRSVNRGATASGSMELAASESLTLAGDASLVSVSLGSGDAADIDLSASQIDLSGTALVSSRNDGAGGSGAIRIEAGSLTLTEGAAIRAETGEFATANGADIVIDVDRLDMADAATIASLTFSSANAGQVEIVADRIRIDNDAIVQASTRGPGRAGDIRIRSDDLALSGAGTIEVSSGFLGDDGDFGDAGNIEIRTDTLSLTGADALISSETLAGGQGGRIVVEADSVALSQGARLSVAASGGGDAGSIEIRTTELRLDGEAGVESTTEADGDGGDIHVSAGTVELGAGTTITARSEGSGLAGNIQLSAARLDLIGAGILTSARSADGGNIGLDLSERLLIRDGRVETAVSSGAGNGGNITIDEPVSIVLQRSLVSANAFGGDGGNIDIAADGLILDPDSGITASSALGIDGEINIRSPENDVQGLLAALPNDFLQRVDVLADQCDPEAGGKSRLVVTPAPVPLQSGELPWFEVALGTDLSRRLVGRPCGGQLQFAP